MTTSTEIDLILQQMKTLLGQTTVLAAEVAKNYNNFTASPAFTGVPTAPTAAPGTNTTQLATTAYLDRLIGQPNGLATLGSDGLIPTSQLPALAITQIFVVNSQAAMLALDAQPGDIAIRTDVNQTYILTADPASTLGNWTLLLFAAPVTSVFGRTGDVVATTGDYTVAQITGAAPLASPTFTGTPTAPTPGTNINTTQIPTTAWVNTWYAAKASPTFTGVPAAPTAAANTNTTQIATTAFVVGQAGTATPLVDGTAAVGTALRFAREDHVHPTDTTRAAVASPTFTGVPAAPTAAPGTNTTQLATTAFVTAAVGAIVAGVSSVFGRSGAVTAQTGDYAVAQVTGAAPLASPTFTGTPAAPTPVSNIATTQIPTTAWVNTYFATLASPTFTGTPAGPTAAANTNTTQLATTAFVVGQAGAATPLMDGSAAVGTSLLYARQDHVHPTDTTRAPLASPTFTGTPAAPTAAPGTNTTQIATTAFVQAAVGGAGSVSSVFGRAGAVVAASGDYTVAQVTGAAPLASPTFTGVPAGPTAAANTNTTQLATTAFVVGQAGTSNPLINGTVAVGTSLLYARQDHVHPTDTTRAPLASPTFTGTPAAPTAAANTNTTQIATTAFVVGQAGSANPLMNGSVSVGTSLLYARQDHVHPVDTSRAPLASPTFTGKVTTAASATGGAGFNMPHGAAPTVPANGDLWTTTTGLFGRINGVTAQFAPIDAPAFTGVPTAPTAANGTNTTQIATTAFVLANAGAPVAGAGISVSGSTVSLDTNNSLGIGSMIWARSISPVGSGSTIAGSSLTVYNYDTSVNQMASTAVVPTGTWRNVSGASVTSAQIGNFIRVS